MKSIGVVIGVWAAAVAYSQPAPLDLQVGYAARSAQSGDSVQFQPIDGSISQVQGVTAFSWRVAGTLPGSSSALVRVRWFRGEVKLLDGVLTLPEQLGMETSFNVAATPGLYRAELLVSLRPGQPEERLKSIEFEVMPPTLDATEPFEDLRAVARQKEEAWRWKVKEITAYTVARFLPSCNLDRIRLAMREPEPLMALAENQWRAYHTSRVEKLNDEQNQRGNPLPKAEAELKVLERELQAIIAEIQKTKNTREVLIRNGLSTANSDTYLLGLEKEDKPAKEKAIHDKEQLIRDLIAEQTQAALDLAMAQRDLNRVDSDAGFERDNLTELLRGYERRCRTPVQPVPAQ